MITSGCILARGRDRAGLVHGGRDHLDVVERGQRLTQSLGEHARVLDQQYFQGHRLGTTV